ncbi:MAG TPA: TonB-dependent receptor, partial [Cyclobacteriaceae bacterium]|nr:TonB-dependent receptor [Cyclobacteriaceae bacterium]
RVQSMEIGYKGLINNKLMLDLSYYYNIYNDFISQIRIVTAAPFTTANAPAPPLVGSANYATILNSTAGVVNNDGSISGNTYQIYTNIDDQVTTQGFTGGFAYSLRKGYTLTGNYSWNIINDVPDGFLAEFNTPEHKINLGFGNRKVTDKLGFNINYRWQDEFEWQSSFTIPANGMVPAYSTVDAQVSYRIPDWKSVIKVGGSNLINQPFIQSLGGPNIGAIYYISLTFDELMR